MRLPIAVGDWGTKEPHAFGGFLFCLLYRLGVGFVKRAGCLAFARKSRGEKLSAVPQSLAVDAVPDPLR